MNTVESLKKLCVCGKTNYANGEKAKFSGLMNTWHVRTSFTYIHKRYVSESKRGKEMYVKVPTTVCTFAYKQKPVLDWNFFNRHRDLLGLYPDKDSQYQYLIKNRKWDTLSILMVVLLWY